MLSQSGIFNIIESYPDNMIPANAVLLSVDELLQVALSIFYVLCLLAYEVFLAILPLFLRKRRDKNQYVPIIQRENHIHVAFDFGFHF